MRNKSSKKLKLFYSINEVAQMFNLNESTLRYWETEFKELQPQKGRGGTRQYREKDIELIRLIHYLLRKKGMTIDGAKQQLEYKKDPTTRQVEVIQRLNQVRSELKGILDALDQDIEN